MPSSTHRRELTERCVAGVHLVRSGRLGAPAVLLLHGWPLDWTSYRGTLAALGDSCDALAIDLPGIGRSVGAFRSGEKRVIAEQLVGVLDEIGLRQLVVVGQDVGGMVAYALCRRFPERVRHAVIVDTVVPGVDPWEEVLRIPGLWHFAFHAVPGLPELLVQDHRGAYFDFFFDTLAGRAHLADEWRRSSVQAYADPRALHAGFEWYRAFPRDAEDNRASAAEPCPVPMLCLRGEDSRVGPEPYVEGLRRAGVREVTGRTVKGAGHFVSEQQPEQLAAVIQQILGVGDLPPPAARTV